MYTLLTPWPPQRNGIADYAHEIARQGTDSFRLVTEALRPRRIDGRSAVIDEAEFLASPGRRRLYHIGNNPDHSHLVPLFLRHPGHVVLHDLSLAYLAECTDRRLPGFHDAMMQAGTAIDIAALRRCWRQGLKIAADTNELRCLSWLREAPAIIVHSHYAARILGAHLPGVPVHVIPHFAYLRPDAAGWRERRRAARARLGYDEARFVVVTLGFVTRNKLYDGIIRGIAGLPSERRRRISYVVAGEIRPGDYDPRTAVTTVDTSFVDYRGFVSVDLADDLLDAADLVVNLRFPTFGESSGAVARGLGNGAAMVVSDVGSFAELPEGTCFRVPARADVARDIAALITLTMDEPERIAAVRDRGFAHARDALSPRRCAAAYEAVLHG